MNWIIKLMQWIFSQKARDEKTATDYKNSDRYEFTRDEIIRKIQSHNENIESDSTNDEDEN